MCTLSFIPTDDGYLAGMNRDELLTRPVARPPETLKSATMRVTYPSEPEGGTWIGSNSSGMLLALLNSNDCSHQAQLLKNQSRGDLIPQLIWESNLSAVEARLVQMELRGMLPFRLVGIFREELAIAVWHWNGTTTERIDLPWVQQHWFSSSVSDASATKERGAACQEAARLHSTSNRHWLRALHASHIPAPGAFSICVHRDDAATVSYTEVSCQVNFMSMEYLPGYPCRRSHFTRTGKAKRPVALSVA